jgi:excisionase family DNA binding protein
MATKKGESIMKKLLNVKDVEDRLNIRQSTLRAWIFQGKIPVVRIGRLVRFKESDLDRWLKDQEVRR